MSVHKSLVSKMGMSRSRNVYRRDERLAILVKEGRVKEGAVLGLPKTRVVKALKKAAKAEKKAEEKGAVSSAPAAAAAPAAGAKAAPAAAAKPAAGGDKKAAAPAKK